MSRLVVVKLGGNAALASLPAVARMAREARICVVHGGGAQISALARERGIQPHFVGGRRVTDRRRSHACAKGSRAVADDLCAALAAPGSRRWRSPTA